MIAKARRHHDETTMRRCGRILAAVLAIEGMSVTHEKVTLFIHTGPRASDQHQVPDVSTSTLLGDLMTGWRKDYGLREQDAQGNLIQYGLFMHREGRTVRLDTSRTLRTLRVTAFATLYLSDVKHLWIPLPSTDQLRPPLVPPISPPIPPPVPPNLPPIPPPVPQNSPPIPPMCTVELAPGCSRSIADGELQITRSYLLDALPRNIAIREKARMVLGFSSPLQAVSMREGGHCAIRWARGWYLHAFKPVFLGEQKLDHGEALLLEQTTTLVIGREGWPITIRLSSTLFTR